MTSNELKKQILEIFQRNRQSPDSNFDEVNFLDYLLNPPASKNKIKNSFKGVRRYYKFFDDIELTFGICFSISDQDRFYSVDEFVEKTKERINKAKGNRMIIKRRLEEKDHYYIEFLFTLILVIICVLFKVHVISMIALICYSIVIWWIVNSKLRYRQHNKLLFKRIMDKDE